ncbi:MAG TPA: lipoyl synthase [Candidatus Thermoplasmatota archaeon]|nr:lipoyl synthase [Candidatus Thermoplasmatota archaeon]
MAAIPVAPPGGREPKPAWLKRPLPSGPAVNQITQLLRENNLHTVCEEARCPNRGECWAKGEATLMIGGDTCTRGCRFCDVKTGMPAPLDVDEPEKVAKTVDILNLSYVVVTSVDRDELPDQGAGHWVRTIEAVKRKRPATILDILTPDFRGDENLIRQVAVAGADVHAHNIETTRSLHTKVRDRRAKYDQSLDVLRAFKKFAPHVPTKTGIMVGHGETREELLETFRDLLDAGVDFLTVGQYLRPTTWHLPVERYWTPEEFEDLEREAYRMGFGHAVSGPFVRSSYKAWEIEGLLRAGYKPRQPA